MDNSFMKSYVFNVPTLVLGLLSGALFPVSQWYVSAHPPIHQSVPIKFNSNEATNNQTVSVLSDAPAPTKWSRPNPDKMSAPPTAVNEEKIFSDLNHVLVRSFSAETAGKPTPATRDVAVVEFSRREGMERILRTVFTWQRQNPDLNRDLIFYLAPTKASHNQETLMAESLKKFLAENPLPYRIRGKTAVLFHNKDHLGDYSLSRLIARARTAFGEPHPGLLSQSVRGPVKHIVWIRTTLSRWKLMPKEGILIDGQSISPEKIDAFLIDPNRKLIMDINLISNNNFTLIAKLSQ